MLNSLEMNELPCRLGQPVSNSKTAKSCILLA
jgi:hypothetical protein